MINDVRAVYLLAGLVAASGCSGGPKGDAGAASPADSLLGILPASDATAPTCKETTQALPFVPHIADVLILFDRSGSMNTAFGHGTRYSVETDILDQLLPIYDDKIRFGFQQFPGRRVCPIGYVMSCCADTPSVWIAPRASERISIAMDEAAPVDGNTPTAEALRYARESYQSLEEDDVPDKYVLLSTDGRPSCTSAGRLNEGGSDDLGLSTSRACSDALAEVDALVTQKVKVIVLGVGPGLDTDPGGQPSCLDEMARRGGVPRTEDAQGPAFFTGVDAEKLEMAFQQIFGGVMRPSCVVTLKAPPANPEQVGVFLDGKEVPKNRDNGWDYDPPLNFQNIKLFGQFCKKLDRFQVSTIEVRYGCAPCTDAIRCE